MDYKENKKKWLMKNGFSCIVGKASMNRNKYIPNYVTATPSEPPCNYKFREVSKEKWLMHKNFIV